MIIANPTLSGSVNISGSFNINGNDLSQGAVQSGTSGSRDLITPKSGSLWFNTNTATLEVYSGASGSGWSSVGSSAASAGPYLADFLVVAGGGGAGNGGSYHESGGGGAGGLRTSYGTTSGGGASNETSLEFTPGIVYTVTVGAGGSARTSGQDSELSGTGISAVTSVGGGYGGDNVSSIVRGGDGGSGGGSSYNASPGGSGTAGQGYDGGTGDMNTPGPNNGGGGGGAGAAGIDGDAASNRAYGGNGLAVNIISTANATTSAVGEVSGADVYFAGGGGGGAGSGEASTRLGGLGGGGDAPVTATTGGAGTANTGGGGGGCASSTGTGGAGGSGVVILRMATSNYSGTYTGSSVDVYTEGSDTVLVFKSSGTYTA